MILTMLMMLSIASVDALISGGIPMSSSIPRLRSAVRLPVFYDDTSILRYVSRSVSLSQRSYVPTDLISIASPFIDQAGRNSQLRREARDALLQLSVGFYEQFATPLMVVSGYRSAGYQQRLWDLGRCSTGLCAPPGYSEHQLGLAVDLFDASTEREFFQNESYTTYYRWLSMHAHLYGWTQSYRKGVEIDAYAVEPWHWRYVGVPLATRLSDLGWTYTEFVRFQEAIARR